jgi:hypothetical protein
VSLELAYVLTALVQLSELPKLELRYEGQESLKGVLGGRPYPLFWIDTHLGDALTTSENKLLGSQQAVGAQHVREFCELFLGQNDSFLVPPFIIDDIEPSMKKTPAFYLEKLQHLAAVWRRAMENREVYKQSMSEVPRGEAETIELDVPLETKAQASE